jgi:hypothetical protein
MATITPISAAISPTVGFDMWTSVHASDATVIRGAWGVPPAADRSATRQPRLPMLREARAFAKVASR